MDIQAAKKRKPLRYRLGARWIYEWGLRRWVLHKTYWALLHRLQPRHFYDWQHECVGCRKNQRKNDERDLALDRFHRTIPLFNDRRQNEEHPTISLARERIC